jgi:hypothetical protein
MKQFFITIITCLISGIIFSQAPKTSVAIMPFVYSMPDYKNRASQIQEIVIELLSKKSSINLIDRSKDTLLLRELDFQIREQSIASKDLVRQGKVLGAQNMIIGTVSNIKVEEKKGTNGISIGNLAYKANISYSLQLMDVESGMILSQKSFSNAKAGILDMFSGPSPTSEAAIAAAIRVTKKSVLEWLNESYPPDIKILRIEERDKKGLPATILVTGIDEALAKGTKLSLNEIEMLDAGEGKKLKRSKNIADLKISDKQGEITICKITAGEKTIEEKINSGVKLEVLIN